MTEGDPLTDTMTTRGSARCVACGRKARVTKLDTLARHRDEYGHVCDNSGLTREQAAITMATKETERLLEEVQAAREELESIRTSIENHLAVCPMAVNQ